MRSGLLLIRRGSGMVGRWSGRGGAAARRSRSMTWWRWRTGWRRGRPLVRASEVVKVYAQIKLLWPPRLVDPLTDEAAVMVAAALPSEATLAHALAVVNDFFRRGSPFPPSWPEIAERWTARAHGVSEDPGL